MAKIERKNQKIFGLNAGGTGISEFGSKAAGAPAYSTNLDDIQTAEWLQGWMGAILSGTRKLPAFEDMNATQYVMTRQLAYLLQQGIPEWNTSTDYYQYSIVCKTNTYELYGSKVNNNLGNALPVQVDDANWQYLGDLSILSSIDGLPAGTQGDILYNNGTDWVVLTPGTNGQVLKTQGAAANPLWYSLPDSSESVKGITEIATQSETNTGTDDTRMVTPLKLASYSGILKSVNFLDTNIVNNQPVSASWSAFDISTVVGVNLCLVLIRVIAVGGTLDIAFRTEGDSLNIGYESAANYGGGCTAATIASSASAYVWIKTNSSGVFSVKKGGSGTNYTMDVVAYIK